MRTTNSYPRLQHMKQPVMTFKTPSLLMGTNGKNSDYISALLQRCSNEYVMWIQKIHKIHQGFLRLVKECHKLSARYSIPQMLKNAAMLGVVIPFCFKIHIRFLFSLFFVVLFDGTYMTLYTIMFCNLSCIFEKQFYGPVIDEYF